MTLQEYYDKIIDFIINTHLDKIPQCYYDYFLNYLGVTIAGSKQQPIDIVIKTLSQDHSGNYYPINCKESLSLADCALIDCFRSSILAYDDIHFPTSTHPCGPIASSLLAYSRQEAISIHDFLEALCIGMEIECRLGILLFSNNQTSWYTTGIVGSMGVASALTKVMHLSINQIKNAFSLACNIASGTRGSHGSMAGSFIPALACQNGYLSTCYAQHGFTCSDTSFYGENGYIYQICSHPNIADSIKDLGTKYISQDVICKLYLFGFISYACIDSLRDCTMDYHTIHDITIEISSMAKRLGSNLYPSNQYEAFVSILYLVARTLINKDSLYQPITNNFSINHEEEELINKMQIIENSYLNDDESDIYIDNQLFSSSYAHTNMSHNDIINKFKRLTHINQMWIDNYYQLNIQDIYQYILNII